jgi:nitrogen-specific signal transduction histidine kinase
LPEKIVMTERRKLGHDLRNAMNAIMLNVQCLKLTTGADAMECADAIVTATDAATELIDRLALLPDESVAPELP